MGGNLFYLRGWSITLVAGLLALLSQKDSLKLFPFLMLSAVIIIFWIYDGYFLSLERKYRRLYDKVRELPENKIDFSMEVEEFSKYKDCSLFYCVLSKTLAPFYIFLLGATIYLILIRS
ncbi:hypothetical protein KC867_03495 [Candidatus Saccharibacteria bacterium]|nr:hypothetical protein [Candidatus Saccharibacteria bacterium]